MKKIKINFRYILFSIFGVALIGTLGFLLFQNMKTTDAANMGDFRAGNIMSDEVMSDYNSMSESEIQNWLNVNNPCNNYDRALYEEQSRLYPNVKWHFTDHFICMSEERFGNGTVIGSGDTAAHIIWQAAQDYRINPKVLLVLLQKENGLVTDNFPHSGQYKTATGFGCPDTAPCEEEYFGFKNQIRRASSLFREVLDGGWSNYPAYQNNYVQYNPNAGCGGTTVYIENRATSALYRYTPYQPNAAALASSYGDGDACSAYGNRNFYSYYTDWFGDIHHLGPIGEAIQLSEGIYNVASSVNSHKSMDVFGGKTTSGSNVGLWDSDYSGNQRWQIKDAGNGYYYFINPQSKKYLDLDGAIPEKGRNIQIWQASGSCAQKWKPVKTPDNYITLVSACSGGYVIDLPNSQTANGTNITLWTANNGPNQKWILRPARSIQDGTYNFTSRLNAQKAMDVFGFKTTAGAEVGLWEKNKSTAQEWTVVYDHQSKYYYITNPHSQKRLDLYGGLPKSGSQIDIWYPNNSCAQKWGILEKDNGEYAFTSACGVNQVIDLNNSKTQDGSKITSWQANNGQNQKWYIEKTTTLSEGIYNVASSVNSHKSMDVFGGKTTSGSNVGLWDSDYSGNQRWQIKDAGNGYYYFINPQSKKYLDLDGAIPEKGRNIQIWQASGSCAQKWKPVKMTDDTFTILSACSSNIAIDLFAGHTENGSNIGVWNRDFSKNQQWVFRKVD